MLAPSGAFRPYAGVSTAILLFTKTNSGGTERGQVMPALAKTMSSLPKGEQHPPVVGRTSGGRVTLTRPDCELSWRRQQRLAGTTVEMRTAEAGQRTRP